ncbi:MAG: iron-sulfur cluster assembly protein IscA [Gammaproteobacteria bacterium]|nr:iron-sulfur cluster assembly protein IscA [Gammaproteobacteria bacterium]
MTEATTATAGISLSERAAVHVRDYLTHRGKGEGIRVGVKTSGCSGLAYVLEFVDQVDPHDQKFVTHGVNVFIDPKSMVYLDGLEMDYVKEGLNEGFRFDNPNKKGECGCGESFTV